MQRITTSALAIAMLAAVTVGCQTETEEVTPDGTVSPEVTAHLQDAGYFTNTGLFKVEGGVIVEGDIFISDTDLAAQRSAEVLGLPTPEHYSTTNLVGGLPRVIRVHVSTSFNSNYFNATDAAIARYNAENLGLTFQRVTNSSQADIRLVASPWYYGFFGILGSAGFPTASGNPHNQIMLTRSYYDNVTDLGALTTTIAHEMGHCIGFRHTDYMDRSYSCGGATDNEGASDVGANYIPGTPTGPEARSWMLACSDGTDRPFTSGDRTALNYLY
jgi:hypothetical protein